MKTLKQAIFALFAPSTEEIRARVLEGTSPDWHQFSHNTVGLGNLAEAVRGPVACADCSTLVDDAVLGRPVLCESCHAEVMGRR